MKVLEASLMPFLYPCIVQGFTNPLRSQFTAHINKSRVQSCRRQTTLPHAHHNSPPPPPAGVASATSRQSSHLDPLPSDYSRSIFVDKCTIQVRAGSGGNGCVSFLRDKYTVDGPPNGGDGGSGGSVWIQAVAGHTSLHKLARRGVIKAGRGIGGQGKSQGGSRGADVLIQVPIGTVVREVWRSDPTADKEERLRVLGGQLNRQDAEESNDAVRRDGWILYPGTTPSELKDITLPKAPGSRRSNMAAMQPKVPITLDLSENMEKPILLAAGAVGGLGNPHFTCSSTPKPKYASKGELGVRIQLELELKLLADLALVGLPNAGKSTLLRSMSNSRTRIGDWPFTTLSPNIGTVTLDNSEGRPLVRSGVLEEDPRANFTVADIPGLIEDAHLDKGLGLGFLRHIERARMLAFVIDLNAGDAVLALQNLWKEVSNYENLRSKELNEATEQRMVEWSGFDAGKSTMSGAHRASVDALDSREDTWIVQPEPSRELAPLELPPISAKPWFVVATKADKDGPTQQNFTNLQTYMQRIEAATVKHPSGRENAWRSRIAALPVSAIRSEGVGRVVEWTAALLDSLRIGG